MLKLALIGVLALVVDARSGLKASHTLQANPGGSPSASSLASPAGETPTSGSPPHGVQFMQTRGGDATPSEDADVKPPVFANYSGSDCKGAIKAIMQLQASFMAGEFEADNFKDEAKKKELCQKLVNSAFPKIATTTDTNAGNNQCVPGDDVEVVVSDKGEGDATFTFKKTVTAADKDKVNSIAEFITAYTGKEHFRLNAVFKDKAIILAGFINAEDAVDLATAHCSGFNGKDNDGDDSGGSSCFAGQSSVLRADGRTVPLKQLREGDLVQTRVGFEPLTGLLHKADDAGASRFLEITTPAGAVIASHTHMLFGADGAAVVAGDVVAGATLAGVRGSVTALSVRPAVADGFVAPLTPSGTIVVDGVVASCYAAPASLPLSHAGAHAAMAPLRAVGLAGSAVTAAPLLLVAPTSA